MLYDDQHFNDALHWYKKILCNVPKTALQTFPFFNTGVLLTVAENVREFWLDLEFSLNVFIKEKLGYKDFTIAMQIH